MRAVNLIPADERRGAGGAGGRSGGFVYVVLGVLAVAVVMITAYTLASKSLGDKKSELSSVRAEAASELAKAQDLSVYTQFAALRAKRVETVKSLAASRFDWAHVMREIARVIPKNVWLTSVVGTVAPNVSAGGGGGGGTAGLRSSQPVPAVQIIGCTTNHPTVSRMLARMRLIDGVQRVSLASSQKADTGGGPVSGGGGGGDCRNGSDRFPQFELVAFFAAPATPAVPTTQPGTTPAAATPGGTQ